MGLSSHYSQPAVPMPSRAALSHPAAAAGAAHQPIARRGEGQVTKSLKLSPNPQGFFLNLAVNDRQAGKDAKYMTTLTPAEARVWRSLLDVSLGGGGTAGRGAAAREGTQPGSTGLVGEQRGEGGPD